MNHCSLNTLSTLDALGKLLCKIIHFLTGILENSSIMSIFAFNVVLLDQKLFICSCFADVPEHAEFIC